jgi:hypothetical protein
MCIEKIEVLICLRYSMNFDTNTFKMAKVLFSLQALGACDYQKFADVMNSLLPALTLLLVDVTERINLVEEVRDKFPATAYCSFISDSDSESIMEKINLVNRFVLSNGICSVENVRVVPI